MMDMRRKTEMKIQQELFLPLDTAQLIESASLLEVDKRSHFLIMMTCILDCYRNETEKAVLIMKNEKDGSTAMAAINANEIEAEEMVDLMSQAMRARSGAMVSGMIN